jgi:hypothetical protein
VKLRFSGASDRLEWPARPNCFSSGMAERGPDRHLPLRARSSSGLAAGALTYDHGLEAHTLVERPRRGRPWSRSFLSDGTIADTSAAASPCARNLQRNIFPDPLAIPNPQVTRTNTIMPVMIGGMDAFEIPPVFLMLWTVAQAVFLFGVLRWFVLWRRKHPSAPRATDPPHRSKSPDESTGSE